MGHYLLFPAYNEEKNIGEVLKEAVSLVPKNRIVVVDDGSTDRTEEIVKSFRVFLVSHSINKGKAEAIKTGLKFLLKKKDFKAVAICDSDGQYSVKDALRLLEPIKNGKADFVMGFRNFKNIPFRHRLGNIVWRSFFNLLFGTKFFDTNCGLMAMNRKAAKIVVNKIHGGYILENSVLIAILKEGLKADQIPVEVTYKRKRGLISGIRIVLGVLIFILQEGLKHRFLQLFAKKKK